MKRGDENREKILGEKKIDEEKKVSFSYMQ